MRIEKQETRNKKILKLEDFRTWEESMKLAEIVYEISVHFPKAEQYGLTSQLRRAAVSISTNLAEGFGRQHTKDKEQFYVHARGSLYEVKSLLIMAQRLEIYADQDQILENQLNKCLNLIGALLRAHRISR